MEQRILVAYASWAGSTQSVAETIGTRLQELGETVEILPAKKVQDISTYDVIILGSAVRGGMLHNDAHLFVERFAQTLPSKKVACFVVCMTMREDTPENQAQADAYIESLVSKSPGLKLLARGKFGGVMDASKLKGLFRLMMARAPQGDYRNWEAINEWITRLHEKLK